MSDQVNEPEPRSTVSRVASWILRLFFVVVAGLALGAALYFGTTALYSNYVQSVQTNAQQIEALSMRLQSDEDQSQQGMDRAVARLQALEAAGDKQKAALDALQTRLDGLETASNEQAKTLQGFSTLSANLQSLQTDLQSLKQDSAALQTEIDGLAKEVSSNDPRLQRLEAQLDDKTSLMTEMEQQIQTFKVVELLTRARYNLVQNNLGTAYQDIQSAYTLLQESQASLPMSQADTADQALTYLRTALDNLPQRPVAAADGLDGAWYLLVAGSAPTAPQLALPQIGPTQTETPSITPTPGPGSATPTPSSPATQTPGPSVTPTSL